MNREMEGKRQKWRGETEWEGKREGRGAEMR